jgi:predicted metalloprotease
MPGQTQGQVDPQRNAQRDAAEQPTVQFISFVLDDVQKNWATILQAQGVPYRHAKLVLYRDLTASGCAGRNQPPAPSTAPKTKKSISISAFTMNLSNASALRDSLLNPMC